MNVPELLAMLNASYPKVRGDHKSRPIIVSDQRKSLLSVDISTRQRDLQDLARAEWRK